MLYRFKGFLCTACAAVCALVGFLGVRCLHATQLSAIEGERTYYTTYKSSCALIKDELHILDTFTCRGESVCFDYEGDYEKLVRELLTSYDAHVLFVEDTCDTRSYYAYSFRLGEGVGVNGALVNLHIAVSRERCSVGTPLIFGGF